MPCARIASSVAAVAILLMLAVAVPSGQGREPVTHEALWLMPRVGAPVLSPDGKWVVFPVVQPSYDQKNESSDLWLVPADGGAPPRQVTSTRAAENAPAWSADGRRLAFVTRRDGDEAAQVYVLDLEGQEAIRVTSLSTGAASPKWRPDGRALLFTSEVYPNAVDDDANRKIATARRELSYNVRAYDSFPVRDWNGGAPGSWLDDRRRHLLVQSLEPGAGAVDLLATTRLVKNPGFGGVIDAAWAPDGQSIVFAAMTERQLMIKANVAAHLHVISATGGEPKALTSGTVSYSRPFFSRDGRTLYAGAMDDHEQIYAHRRIAVAAWPWAGAPAILDPAFDRSTAGFEPGDDRDQLTYLIADDDKLYAVARTGGAKAVAAPARGGYGGLRVAATSSGPVIVANWGTSTNPTEIVRIDPATGRHRLLTAFNTERAARLNWQPLREFTFTSSRGKSLRSVMVVPPNLDEKKKHPLIVLIHGGPAGRWRDQVSVGWSSYHTLAELGYVVIATDYVGSTGYGEAFARAIRYDPMDGPSKDVNEAADEAVRRFPFIDGTRQCAMGASWGGVVIAWMHVTTTRYSCLVHLVSAFSQDVIWSNDQPYWWALMNGGPPWDAGARTWQEQNPLRRAAQMKTPILISSGEQDYRALASNALEYWNVVQYLGIPGRLLIWPTEGHGISSGGNSRYFFKELRDWLARWLQPGAGTRAGQ